MKAKQERGVKLFMSRCMEPRPSLENLQTSIDTYTSLKSLIHESWYGHSHPEEDHVNGSKVWAHPSSKKDHIKPKVWSQPSNNEKDHI